MKLWLDRRAAYRLIRRIHEEHGGEKTYDQLTVEAAMWMLAGDERVALRLLDARAVRT